MTNRSDAEQAEWLADKIGALGDYAKEAAAMLRRWPAAGGVPVGMIERAEGEVDISAFRKNISPELWRKGDAVLCWVNEGALCIAGLEASTAAARLPSPDLRESPL